MFRVPGFNQDLQDLFRYEEKANAYGYNRGGCGRRIGVLMELESKN